MIGGAKKPLDYGRAERQPFPLWAEFLVVFVIMAVGVMGVRLLAGVIIPWLESVFAIRVAG